MRVPPHTAQVAKALSFALGKRFAVAKLTASLSARAKLRPRLLVASGRLIPSPEIQVSTGKDLLIPRGRAGLEASYLSPISPPFSNNKVSFQRGEPSLFGSSSAQCGTPPFFGSHWVYLVYRSTQWQQEKAILCYTPVISFLPRHANSHRVPDHIPCIEKGSILIHQLFS